MTPGFVFLCWNFRNRVGTGLSYRPAKLHYVVWRASMTTRFLLDSLAPLDSTYYSRTVPANGGCEDRLPQSTLMINIEGPLTASLSSFSISGDRALLDIKLIWFGYVACLSEWGEGGYFSCSNNFYLTGKGVIALLWYTDVFVFYRLRTAAAHCTLQGTELNGFVLLGLSMSSCVDGTSVSGLDGTWILRAVM